MSQSDGEPDWEDKIYTALKDKKHLTGINKEESADSRENLSPRSDFEEYTYY